MKVAITGGTGFLGEKVVLFLEKYTSYIPIVLTRGLINSNNKRLSKYVETDYSVDNLKQALKNVQAVIHLASIRGKGGEVKDFHINEVITDNLYKACSELNIKNIVFASSIAVYSETDEIPWTEEQIVKPKTFYGISKVSCEYIGELYHKKSGLNIKSLRIAQILGEEERKGMMNTFIDNAHQGEPLKVIGKSIAKREFVYVKDVVKAIILALKNEQIHGSYNIGNNVSYSNLEIAETVSKVFNNSEIVYIDALNEDIESSLMDSSKAEKVLGYSPKWGLKEALEDIKNTKQENKNV
ncbi:NAD-dependent epimerase/dehydratase family protein [Thalassobacillus pellis]|uniref:NAD-dependent epimerase/dehydratase family protein n=1 Tax=Thalassobacillus pellis TaxID=748008 RepID=UPI0019612D89|nr:NAD(P)-dependent oxidoreductase [Thalassobacillus pellis]MBM7551665.1 UDP-glucose 4-epimerase [Thalassobacillus pellis]